MKLRKNLFLAYIDELIVTEIDGEKPADILPELTVEPVVDNVYDDGGLDEDEDEELLEEDDTADLLPLYDAIIDRLDGHSNDHLNEKVDYIFNKRF